MNILLLLAAGMAIVVVFAAYRHLKWQPIMYLGGLFAAVSTAVLLVHHTTPLNVYEAANQTFGGEQLARYIGAGKLLDESYWFLIIALLCGITLMLAALFKKRNPEQSDETFEEPLSETESIRAELQEATAAEQKNIDDPKERGEQDASSEGGPIPDRQATESGGYETYLRRQYESLGNNFLAETVQRIKQEIIDALEKLTDIKNKVNNPAYVDMATSEYDEKDARVSDHDVQQKRHNVTHTNIARNKFIDTLHLGAAEQPDWGASRSSVRDISLWVIFLLFVTWEFIVSWYFLESQIGAQDAIKYSVIAVGLISVLAFVSAWCFQWRRHIKINMRILFGTFYSVALFFLFIGFGMLLNARDVQAKGVVGLFDTVLDGYVSLFSDLTNLIIFILNLLAFAVLYWKVMHCFDRFHGYNNVDEPYQRAKTYWGNLFADRAEVVEGLLNKVDEQANTNSGEANQAFKAIQEKKSALEGMSTIINTAYTSILHQAYHSDIREYRKSNCEKREIEANPAPEYFHDEAPFCDTQTHFTAALGIEKFLKEHNAEMEQANEHRKLIQQAKHDWQVKSSKLNAEWIKKFQERVHSAGK